MIPHFMLIQACYTDAELSRRRLNIARHTSAASLSYQTQKPVVHLVQHPNDPHASRREGMYRSAGCEIKVLFRDSWKLYGENWELPEGRKVVSRIDDDDVICRQFCEKTFRSAPESGDVALIWPTGYVLWRGRAYLLKHRGNQFVSLVTDGPEDPHRRGHWVYCKEWRSVVVSNAPGWMWIRHGDAATPTKAKYRRRALGRIDSGLIPVNVRAIIRATAESGPSAGSY